MDHEQTDGVEAADGEPAGRHGILTAISNEMVAIYKDQFGRGPTRTRTNWSGPDTISAAPSRAAIA